LKAARASGSACRRRGRGRRGQSPGGASSSRPAGGPSRWLSHPAASKAHPWDEAGAGPDGRPPGVRGTGGPSWAGPGCSGGSANEPSVRHSRGCWRPGGWTGLWPAARGPASGRVRWGLEGLEVIRMVPQRRWCLVSCMTPYQWIESGGFLMRCSASTHIYLMKERR